MSDFSRDELELLAGARRALAPSADDAARVLHKARLAIGNGAVPAADGGAAPSAASGVLVKKVLTWLAIAGVAAWLGYNAGFELGEQRAREANASHAPAVSPPIARAPEPSAPSPRVEPSLQAQQPEAAPEVAAPVARVEPTRRKPKLALEPLLAPETDEAPVLAAPPPPPNASLDAEIKALRYAERALRNREPSNALARLAQLDREVPDGQMMEERAAARAMARCEERAAKSTPDQAEVMQRVLEFSQQYPASVYFARVRQTCLATIERDAATD